MARQASVSTGLVSYQISEDGMAVTSRDVGPRTLEMLSSTVRMAMADYSPAFGDPLVFAAEALARAVGGKVSAKADISSEAGVVY